jgi:MFS family permease
LERRPLLFNVLFVSRLNFLVGGTMALSTPYLLARTGSETTLGILLAVLNIGAIAGGIVMGVWGGTNPRIHTIMIGIISAGVCLALIGISQSALMLAVTLFLFMFPLPFVNAAFMSIIQAKVPPDIQGRVFAVLGQISMFLLPLSYLIVGPLADDVFEPAVGQPGWEAFAPLVGSSAGAGMGLIFFAAGVLVTVISLIVYAIPTLRNMEAALPDYATGVAAKESVISIEEPAAGIPA